MAGSPRAAQQVGSQGEGCMIQETPKPGDRKPQEEQENKPVAQKTEAESRLPPSGSIIYKAIYQQGENELRRTSMSLAWSALAAGLSMGFSLATEGLLTAALPDASWSRLISKLGYGMGFVIVVLGSQQLFTENTLTVMLPLLVRRDWATFRNVLRLWGVVLLGNLLGAFVFAWAAGNTNLFPAELKESFRSIGQHSFANPFATTTLRGITAGWIIALMVWLLPFGESARLWIVLILAWLIGVLGAPHVVAGSLDAFYLVATGERSVGECLTRHVLPTLVGNMIGGISLVAAFGHAQFARSTHG
jgi:formate/nitrite transporter FocA (FNT family)